MRKFSSYAEFYENVIREAIEKCSYCGACIDVCRMQPYYKRPENIMEKMINFLKGGELSSEVYKETFDCGCCGGCTDSCPFGIDPHLLHEAAKIEIVKRGGRPPESLNFVLPGQKYNVYVILSALQMRPSEARWLKKVPPSPKKVKNVLFTGCFPVAIPSVLFAFMDVLEKIGVDFVALEGGDLCCGTVFCPAGGMVDESEKRARELVNALKVFSPERVIVVCTGCYRQFTEFMSTYLDLDFEVAFYTDFLRENLEKLNFIKPLEKTVFLQESCMPRRTKVDESIKDVLKAIPGVKIVKSQSLCCGGLTNMTNPLLGRIYGQILVEEAAKSRADYLVSSCPFCRLNSYPHVRERSLTLKDAAELINEAIGGKVYEDKLETYWRCRSVEEIIEKSKENFKANGFTEEEMRKILPLLFAPIQ
ncbi:MAG: (Fe-S)-binding protein [Candidatus Bathyarchaeia archaeon]